MERREPCAVRCRELLRQLVAFMFTNVGVIGLVVGYTIAGAFMFGAIEGGDALDRSGQVLRLRAHAADRLWNVTCCRYNIFNRTAWFNTVSKELLAYQEDIIRAVRSGWDGIDETETSKQWSFSGAFLYSLTVITTIGYGNISPRTVWGKVTTILYAIIGMPLFLLYLSNIGDVLARSFKWTYAMLCLCRGCPGVARRRAARRRGLPLDRQPSFQHWYDATGDGAWWREEVEDDWNEEYDPQSVTVPITLCVIIMVGYMVFGATVFSKWEKWDALDGSYFCFISLSSIGFGDIVPGDQIYAAQKIEASFIVCSVYLLLGMALIAMCFNLMQEQVIHHIATVKRALRRIVRCKR